MGKVMPRHTRSMTGRVARTNDGNIDRANSAPGRDETLLSPLRRSDREPLHRQIEGRIRAAIADARLRPGAPLLGTRVLARELGTARITVQTAYDQLIDDGLAEPLPGAEDTVRALREVGVKVALTTGFGAGTRDRLLAALGWTELADLTLCPAEAGRGRPYPDMVLTAVLRLQIDDVRAVAVAGDTASDITSGLRAGASVVAGVLTGAHDGAALTAAGATHVLDSITDLPSVLGLPVGSMP